MLDPSFVRDHTDTVCRGLQNRGLNAELQLAELAALEERRRALIVQVESLRREQNAAGEEVARLKKAGQDASGIFEANRQRGQQIKQRTADLEAMEHQREAALMVLPNLPHESVPV